MDRKWDKKETNGSEPLLWEKGAGMCQVVALHESLQRFTRPRIKKKKWVQPLDGAFGLVVEKVGHVRVVAYLVFDYLPRYAFNVCLYEPCNGIYPHKPYVSSADFWQENVLRLSVCGRGWESAGWLDRWSNQCRQLAFQTDATTMDNMCGALDWENRKSEFYDRNPPIFLFRVRETEITPEEIARWQEEKKNHSTDLEYVYEDEHDYQYRVWESRLWERRITGSDDQKDVKRAFQLGATTYFVKSPHLADVIQYLRTS